MQNKIMKKEALIRQGERKGAGCDEDRCDQRRHHLRGHDGQDTEAERTRGRQAGQHVDIWPGAAPPNVAEKVVIFHRVGKPLSLEGVVVTATVNVVTVTTGGIQKSFPLSAATKFEALEGTKPRRLAKATELKAGQKVHIVAAAEAAQCCPKRGDPHRCPKNPAQDAQGDGAQADQ